MKLDYEIFLKGEYIDLCIPTKKIIDESDWSSWFNNIKQNKYTTHAVFPNTKDAQYEYLTRSQNSGDLVLLIKPKNKNIFGGVVSLQEIDLNQKSSDFGINIGNGEVFSFGTFAAMEATCLICQHGFDQVGLNRIYSCSPYPGLKGWIKLMEIVGFRTDGILRNSFVKGHYISDTVYLSFLYEDYKKILNIRDGKLWNGLGKIRKLISYQPKNNASEQVDDFLKKLNKDYYSYLDNDGSQ
jgi:RimJ/RimL family protein N-acetyltransferase